MNFRISIFQFRRLIFAFQKDKSQNKVKFEIQILKTSLNFKYSYLNFKDLSLNFKE